MMTLKNTAKLILTAAMTLASSTTFGAEDCEKGGQIGRLGSDLLAVTAAQEGVGADKRRSIDEIAVKSPRSEAEEMALEVARSTVAIKSISRNGQIINDYGYSHHGSGFVIAGGCFVVTVRHVVNRDEIRVVNGQKVYRPSSESPTGYQVEMEIGFGPNQKREMATGEVILSGASILSADEDISIIRLSRKASVGSLPIAAPAPSKLIGAEMISVGLPIAKQVAGSTRAFADTSCAGIDQSKIKDVEPGGIPTSCVGSPGDSGGALLAKVDSNGSKVWRVVGAVAKGDSKISPNISTGSLGASKSVRAFPFNGYKDEINAVIQESLRQTPCN